MTLHKTLTFINKRLLRVYPELICLFHLSRFRLQNRQGNVNSLIFIVQFSRSLSSSLFSRRLCYYITSFRVCQVLFSNFFELFLDSLSSGYLSLSSESLYILSHLFHFVNTFFKNIFKIFDVLSSVRCIIASGQLLYYITLAPVCQHLFTKKYHFCDKSAQHMIVCKCLTTICTNSYPVY